MFLLCCLSEEEGSLRVGKGIWTKLLGVLQLKFEVLNVVFTCFETNVLFLLLNLLSISLVKTCTHHIFLCLGL